MSFDPSKAPLISETLLKKRRSLDELKHRRNLTVSSQIKRRRVVRGEDIRVKRPEQYIKERRIEKGSLNKMNRKKKEVERRKTKIIDKKSIKSTVGFVVRVHEGRHTSEEIKRVLKEMKLTKKYDAIFMNLNEDNMEKLKAYDSYLAYGYLSKKLVDELIHRRAYSTITGKKDALSDNNIVEKVLGDKGILCLNDLSHEIYTVGPHFNDAIAILNTFKLSAPVGNYEKKILHVHDEVEQQGGGFLGTNMDAFLSKLL
jgi:large subunit ribosomal protein L7e